MATLEQLMNECFGEAPKGQEKTASANASSKEVNEVLANLGLGEGAIEAAESVTKTASEEGNNMSLDSIYNEMFGTTQETAVTTEQTVEKTAGEDNVEDNTEGSAFAELTGVYFSEMSNAMLEKVAADLEAEAGAGHNPMPEHSGGQLTGIIGKAKDPHLAVNHKPNADAKLETKGATTPYNFAVVQSYLKRLGGKGMIVGEQK